ncbi:MAG: response regulator transcription factor [Solirubrobacterales bacterium]|nr:response regulator transcription factor [Solirubrobacterales bacterium]
MPEPGAAVTPGPIPAARAQRRRVGIADRDTGFVRTLVKRLPGLAMDPIPVGPFTADTLLSMRLDGLVLDVSVLRQNVWPCLEELAERLPALAVVVCTGPSSVAQRVRGLRLGLDAWISKPCHPEEVVAVLGAVLRRHRRGELVAGDGPVVAGELTIRPDRYQAYVGERSLDLTAREFALLLLMAQNDCVIERAEIYERVWGYAMAHGDRSVDVFVRKLRQKLLAASPDWSYIHTHFGIGYRFAPERSPEALMQPDRPEPLGASNEQQTAVLAALR